MNDLRERLDRLEAEVRSLRAQLAAAEQAAAAEEWDLRTVLGDTWRLFPEVFAKVPGHCRAFMETRRGGEYDCRALYLAPEYHWRVHCEHNGCQILIPERKDGG